MQLVLSNLLLAHAPLAAMVGRNIDWNVSPQGITGPRIVMFLISEPIDYTLAGPDLLRESRVQLDCRAATAAAARQLAEHLDSRLSGFRGEFQGFDFRGCFKRGHRTRSEEGGQSVQVHTASIDYQIWWRPA